MYEKFRPIREVHNRGYSEEGINIRDYINYFYEGNSVRCEMRTTGENGWTKFTTIYDSQLRKIEYKGVDAEGELITWDQFKYHSDGTKACEFSLDENGKLSGVSFIKQSIDQTYERRRLEHGAGISTIVERFRELDNRGSWIVEIGTINGEPIWKYERQIGYY